MADDHGSVYELSLKPNGKSDVRTSWQVSDDSIVSIKGLSVDWLSDRLYLLLEIADGSVGGSWQIARCKLNGRELVHVITDMTHKPFQIEVDPFNGSVFLFPVPLSINRLTNGSFFLSLKVPCLGS